jgi:hypothetical protein
VQQIFDIRDGSIRLWVVGFVDNENIRYLHDTGFDRLHPVPKPGGMMTTVVSARPATSSSD